VHLSTRDLRYQFSLWAAYRATQAGSAKAKSHELISALTHCGVVEFLNDPENHSASPAKYTRRFDLWVTKARAHLHRKFGKQVTYGVAAKLVSTYIKSAFVLAGHGNTPLGNVVIPPIDSILLEGLDKAYDTNLATRYKWQKLSRASYRYLVAELRKLASGRPLWWLEEHWKP
jgi:hypothetical protein